MFGNFILKKRIAALEKKVERLEEQDRKNTELFITISKMMKLLKESNAYAHKLIHQETEVVEDVSRPN